MRSSKASLALLYVVENHGKQKLKAGDYFSFNDGKKAPIVKVTYNSVRNKFALRKVLDKVANDPGLTGILFADFLPFNNDVDKLEMLRDSGLLFRFDNLEAYNEKNINDLIQFIRFNKEYKGKKIRQGFRKKEEKSGSSPIGHVKGPKSPVSRSRILKALNDKKNQHLMQVIQRKRIKENLSFNQIASYLNDQGILTANDNKHYASGVQKLFNRSAGLNKAFRDHLLNDTVVRKERNRKRNTSLRKMEILGIESGEKIPDNISFTIDVEGSFEVIIKDYEKSTVFKDTYPPHTNEVVINLNKAFLLPGVHYLIVRPLDPQYQVESFNIILRPAFQELANG